MRRRNRSGLCDSHGLVTKARKNLEDFKATYARDVAEVAEYAARTTRRITLLETVCNVKPTVLLGTSGTPGTFSRGSGGS